MKGFLFILLACVSCCFSGPVKQGLFPVPPVFSSKSKSTRIVGGQEAAPHSLPFQVALHLNGYFCGGSLISRKYVLTAAHCGEITSRPIVDLGAHRILESEPERVTITATRVTVHPLWNKPNGQLENDIAIVELPQLVQLNANIQTIPLVPASAPTFEGQPAETSGWGITHDTDTSISPVLRYVVSTVLSNTQCQNALSPNIPILPSHVCLDGSQKRGTCSGDSGGPLFVRLNGILTQIGITSFGVNVGCEYYYPTVFTRISSYADWIKANTL